MERKPKWSFEDTATCLIDFFAEIDIALFGSNQIDPLKVWSGGQGTKIPTSIFEVTHFEWLIFLCDHFLKWPVLEAFSNCLKFNYAIWSSNWLNELYYHSKYNFFISDKFQKPALKRVRISADQMLKTLLGSKGKATQIDMRQNLKKKPEKKEGEKA